MAEIILDLSGKGGLAMRFAGDVDMVTPQPNLRLAKTEADLVSGNFNPFLRDGYLAPITDTTVPVTTSVAPSTNLTSVEFDPVEGRVYWADNTKSLYLGSDLADTSLTRTLVLEATDVGTYPDRAYERIYDLQMYQLNGERKLFYVGRGLTYNNFTPGYKVATQSGTGDYFTATVSVLPNASTKPSVVSSTQSYVTGGNTDVPFTVAGGTNNTLWCVQVSRTSGLLATPNWRNTSGTPSFAMTSLGSGTTGGFHWQAHYLNNPTVTTPGAVRSTVNVSGDRMVFIFETNNTASAAGAVNAFSGTAANILAEVDAINKNQAVITCGFLDNAVVPTVDNTYVSNVLDDNTNTYGSDFLYVLDVPVYGLQVGLANLDLTLLNAGHPNWLASIASGAFSHTLDSDWAFMRTADNGFAYIFAGHRVHKIDGSSLGGEDGTATKDVLLFPEYFEITDAVDYRSRLYIALQQYPINNQSTSLTNFTGKCGIYVWDRRSTTLSAADYIEISGVREIKKIYPSPDGQLKLITISDNGLTELRQFGYNDSGGVVFPIQKVLGIGAFPQYPDGLTIAGDKSVWIANDGAVYSESNNAVTKLHIIKAPATTASGLNSNISSGALVYGAISETADTGFRSNKQAFTFSYTDGGTNTVERLYPFDLKTGPNNTQTPNQGDVYSGVNFIPITSIVRRIRIYNAPTANAGTGVIATVKIYFNQKSTPTITKSITKSEAQRGYVDFNINQAYLHAVQIEIEWATSEPLSGDIYLPSVAIVSHDPTTATSSDNG